MTDLPPLHDDLLFNSPLEACHADALASWVAAGVPPGGTVVDVGCGWGELLLRVLEAAPSARGLGLDRDEAGLVEGRRRAGRRGLGERVEFVGDDAATALPASCAALVCVGSSQVWGPPVEQAQPLDYTAALRALRAPLPRGGRLLYGEAVWSRPPTPAATAPLAGRDDELVDLLELTRLAGAAGFAVAGAVEATQQEWDEFESGYAAGWATWLAAHEPDHPDAEHVRASAERQRTAYLGGYRGVLGLAYLRLLAV